MDTLPRPARCPRCGDLPDPGRPPLPCARCGAPPGTEGPADPRPAGFLASLGAPLRGAGFVLRHPGLLLWILLPLAVDLLVLVLLVAAALSWSGDLAPDLADPWPAWIDGLRGPTAWTLRHLARALAVAAAFLMTVALAGTINAPFLDLLSEKTEDLHLRVPDPGRPWSRLLGDGLRSARSALLILLVQAAVLAPLFLLSFTAVGAPLFAAAGAWFAGLGVADIPGSRKRYSGAERVRRALGRKWDTLALGLPVCLLPPLQPLSVVGATLLYLDDPRRDVA